MPLFRFLGNYPTDVTLPDGSVQLANPGDVTTLAFTSPGPLWAPAGTMAQIQIAFTAGLVVTPISTIPIAYDTDGVPFLTI